MVLGSKFVLTRTEAIMRDGFATIFGVSPATLKGVGRSACAGQVRSWYTYSLMDVNTSGAVARGTFQSR